MSDSNEIMVSILCLAYNHEKYIREAFDSFLKQKTNFKFEVLVNDDCSTDGTTAIIREYEKKYPDIIKPVYQTENQYSKGKRIIIEYLLPRAKGKYFVFCECDDYFIDENKLQKQFDFLEQNPDFSLCIHNNIRIKPEGEFLQSWDVVQKSREVTADEVIIGDGDFCATNSIMAPMYLGRNLPSYFEFLSLDYVWQMYLAMSGRVYCFEDKMSAYRRGAPGSWTAKWSEADCIAKVEFYKKIIGVMELMDKETELQHHEAFVQSINSYRYRMLSDELSIIKFQKNWNALKSERYAEYIKHMPFLRKLRTYFRMYILARFQ